jgi:tetratricopeptide (TPR) repeat protein
MRAPILACSNLATPLVRLVAGVLAAAALAASAASPAHAAAAVTGRDRAPDPAGLEAAAQDASLRHYLQGAFLEASGDLSGALDEYARSARFDPKSPAVPIRIAEISIALGDSRSALDQTKRALALGDSTGRAYSILGALQAAAGQLLEASRSFERSLAQDSTHGEIWRALARAHEEANDPEKARLAYQRALALDEDDLDAAFRLGMIEARTGRYGAADTLLAQVEEANPFTPGVLATRAWIAERQARLPAAAALYQRHLELFPADRAVRQRLLGIRIATGDQAGAIEIAKALRADQPNDFEAGRLLTNLYLTSGRNEDALQTALALRREHPALIDAGALAVSVLHQMKRPRDAQKEADALTKEAPGDFRAWLVAGEAWAQGEPADRPSADADKRYDRALALMPDSSGARLMTSRSLGRAHRFARSEELLLKGLETEPRSARLWLELAFAYERRKDVAEAERAGRKAVELAPDDPQALNFLGYLFADYELHLDESVPLIERALEKDPENPYYLDSLGWAFFRLGRLQDAAGALERALGLGGREPEVYEHLGDVYRALSRAVEAKTQYQKALELEPGRQGVARKLADLR